MLGRGTSLGLLLICCFVLFTSAAALGTEIESATLYVYAESAHGATVNVHAAGKSWREREVTWNSFNADFNDAPIASAMVSEAGWCSWDVTAQVQAWVDGKENFGFVLDQKEVSYPRTAFLSKENRDCAPYLQITYIYGDGTVTEQYSPVADTYLWEFRADYNAGAFPKLYTGWQSSNDLEKQTLLLFAIDIPTHGWIGDRVWDDLNTNGLQDEGEPGVDGVTVNLYDTNENPVDSQETQNGGAYKFEVPPGDYFVEFVLPENYTFTFKGQDRGDLLDSDMDPITCRTESTHIELDEHDMSWDAGIYPCDTCVGGVTQLTLRYHGDYPVAIEVYQGSKPVSENLLFLDAVEPGQTFGFTGGNADGTMGHQVSVYVDGLFAAAFRTDCSRPIGPGLLRGGLEVVAGSSRDGGKLSPMPECRECEGGITQLTLQYCGDESRAIEAYEGRKIHPDKLLFADIVDPNQEFTFKGRMRDGTMGHEISLYLDGEFDASICTDCSQPIGAGLIAGSFTLNEGYSRVGGKLYNMPVLGEGECEGGVTVLTLRYRGEKAASIEVFEGYNVTADRQLFKGTVDPNEEFSFSGKGKRCVIGGEINLFVDAMHHVTIHTDCSEPIGPGLVCGLFEVTDGYSLKGGKLVPIEGVNPCEGGITMLMLRYTGERTAFVSIFTSETAEPRSMVFVTSAEPGSSFAFTGKSDDFTMGDAIYIFVSGELNATIPTSGEKPIGEGFVAGDFEVLEGYSRVGGKLPPMQ